MENVLAPTAIIPQMGNEKMCWPLLDATATNSFLKPTRLDYGCCWHQQYACSMGVQKGLTSLPVEGASQPPCTHTPRVLKCSHLQNDCIRLQDKGAGRETQGAQIVLRIGVRHGPIGSGVRAASRRCAA